MCGRYNIIDDPLVQDLLDTLGISVNAETRLNIAPGAKGQIVYETNQGRVLEDAIWSLLIEPKPDGSGYRQMTNTDPLQHLLETRIREPLAVEPFKSPGSLETVGQGEIIEADQR
jgi:putative SOS response-associated peptidase YedK